MKLKKRYLVLILIATPFISIWLSNTLIVNHSKKKTYNDISTTPENKVGLVLGTIKTLKNGNINLYFKYRVNATLALYKAGKIKFVLISGDNGNKNYDEPTDFKDALIAGGIPESKIFLDYAGFRTLDSVVRAKKIFGQNSLTFISQKFHNERAIYLANHFEIDAIGFNAKDVSGKYGLKVRLREYLARTKVFIDIILRVKPKFLGEKINIK